MPDLIFICMLLLWIADDFPPEKKGPPENSPGAKANETKNNLKESK